MLEKNQEVIPECIIEKWKLQCGNDRTCDLHGDRCQSDRRSASGEC